MSHCQLRTEGGTRGDRHKSSQNDGEWLSDTVNLSWLGLASRLLRDQGWTGPFGRCDWVHLAGCG